MMIYIYTHTLNYINIIIIYSSRPSGHTGAPLVPRKCLPTENLLAFLSVIGRSSCHDRMTRIREVYHGNTCATEGFFIEAQKGSISAITF